MSHCLNTCELQDQLRSKETKINKLKQVLDHLESPESLEPHRRQEVKAKNSFVNELIEKTLTEARQLLVSIVHGCERCNPNPEE